MLARRVSRSGRINAVLLASHRAPPETEGIPLWNAPDAALWRARLWPELQVQVHVDYHGHRSAWRAFGMPEPGADFLDHVANRLRHSAYPIHLLTPALRESGHFSRPLQKLQCHCQAGPLPLVFGVAINPLHHRAICWQIPLLFFLSVILTHVLVTSPNVSRISKRILSKPSSYCVYKQKNSNLPPSIRETFAIP